MAADKAEEFVISLKNGCASSDREKFSFTWNGEYRIKNCKKIDLVGAYRLVLIQKDNYFIFLYIGSHDDCFRWIERNKGLSYEIDITTKEISIDQNIASYSDKFPDDLLEEKIFAEQYEKKLMEQLDDNTLAKIFSGLCDSVKDRDKRKHTKINEITGGNYDTNAV